MPKFQYTAVNQQGKNLSGVVEADSEILAKKKLSSLKLTIVGLEQIAEQDTQLDYLKYKFEATDKENKKIVGTISSTNLLEAFKKLNTEYELNILKLASLNASQEEFEASTNKIDLMYQQIKKLNHTLESDNSSTEFHKIKQKQEFQSTIDEIIELIRTILSKYSTKLKPEAIEFLQKYETHLNKIKFSDNQDNIVNAAHKVLSEIQNSKMFFEIANDIQDEIKLHINIEKLNKRLKLLHKNDDDLAKIIQTILEKIGFKSKQKKDLQNLDNTTAFDYLKLALKTKSSTIRNQSILKFIDQLFNFQNYARKQPNASNEKISSTELNSYNLLSWILAGLLTYYFVTVFISLKIPKIEINPVLLIYNTRVIIYALTGALLIYSAIHIRILLSSKNINHSKLSYPLLLFLYILVMLNL